MFTREQDTNRAPRRPKHEVRNHMPFKLTIEQYLSDGAPTVTIPGEVTRLDAHAFRDCESLEELHIP